MTYKVGMNYQEAQELASELCTKLVALGAKKVEITGSILREEEEIGDIDLIIDGNISELAHQLCCELKSDGDKRVTLIYRGQQVNFFRGNSENWGAMQMYLTGPKYYTIAYRVRAKKMGYLLNQDGLFDQEGQCVASATEEDIYRALGKNWKHPRERGR
jgi:DNA polymerase/3'-5' exonuclease PolX